MRKTSSMTRWFILSPSLLLPLISLGVYCNPMRFGHDLNQPIVLLLSKFESVLLSGAARCYFSDSLRPSSSSSVISLHSSHSDPHRSLQIHQQSGGFRYCAQPRPLSTLMTSLGVYLPHGLRNITFFSFCAQQGSWFCFHLKSLLIKMYVFYSLSSFCI